MVASNLNLKNPARLNERNYKSQIGLQTLTIPRIIENSRLCPVSALEEYMERVEMIRGRVDELFVLLRQPSSPAKSQTVSRWCKDILKDAGIEKFGVHSVRSAASCGALLRGVPLDTIIRQAGWSGLDTFVKNYMRPLNQPMVFPQTTDAKHTQPAKITDKLPPVPVTNGPASLKHQIKTKGRHVASRKGVDTVKSPSLKTHIPDRVSNMIRTGSQNTPFSQLKATSSACLSSQHTHQLPIKNRLRGPIMDIIFQRSRN